MTLKYTNKNTMMPLTRDTVFVNNKREEACQAYIIFTKEAGILNSPSQVIAFFLNSDTL